IKSNKNCIGVQVLHLRWRMTRSRGGDPYRFFTDRSELEMNSVRIFRKIFHPRCGLTEGGSNFFIKISPLPGVSNLYKHSSFRRKHFSLRLISSGGKMDRMPMPCALGLALECFQ